MKKVSLLILLTVVSLVLQTAFFVHPSRAQNSTDCDPTALKEWLVQRQSYINATEDVLNVEGMSIEDAQFHLYNHLQSIEDLPRPECTADAMLMTYYFYNQIQHLLVCAQQQITGCITSMQGRIADYRDKIDSVIAPLGEQSGFNEAEYVTLRPAGWSLTAQPAQSSSMVEETIGLNFSGSELKVYDPITIPSGFYKATVTTTGSLIIYGDVLSGTCDEYSQAGDQWLFAAYSSGDANSGAEFTFGSDNCQVMWEIDLVTAPYTVTFEKLQ